MPGLRLLACCACAAVVLTGCTVQPGATNPRTEVLASVDRCGSGWTDPKPGPQHLVIHNTDTRAGEVYLTDAKTGDVYAEVDPLGAGTTQTLDITLGGGSYAFRCAMEDEQTVTGPTVTIAGTASGAAAPVASVGQADLLVATHDYQTYVLGRLPVLAAAVGALQADVARDDLAAARADWLPAHLEYERLGAAYGAFGDLDGAINGLPSGLAQGVDDPSWTGFHRLEYGLWHGQDAATLRPLADGLAASVAQLQRDFATEQIDQLTFALRAHEITENALQFELTGRTDFGSGSNLQTVAADLDGTETVLRILEKVLSPRYPPYAQTLALVQKTGQEAAASAPLASLTTAQREHVDAEVSQLAEDLAPVASILEPRRANE